MKTGEKIKKTINWQLKTDLLSFVKRGFEELNPEVYYAHNWHVDEICQSLVDVFLGKTTRLIINIPPRYLKSICVSVCFPAWLLGRDPAKRIIVSSYSSQIAIKHSLDTKKIMQSNWYKQLFPNTVIAKGQNQKSKFVTTFGGFRMGVSSAGSLTGEGGDVLIIDDPHKPSVVNSRVQRKKVISWFEGTFFSRLDNKKTGSIIIVMQRLHPEDLVGFLLQREHFAWKTIVLRAIANEDEDFRKKGEPLHEQRENLSDLQVIKQDIGEHEFMSQYQQEPLFEGSGVLKESQLHLVEFELEEREVIALSIDVASKAGKDNDFTAIAFFAIRNDEIILFDVKKVKFEFGENLAFIKELILKHRPQFVVIEDKGSGIPLLQELAKMDLRTNLGKGRAEKEKYIRFLSCIMKFEKGFLKIKKNIEGWEEIKYELLNFPNAKNDDVVDAITQFLIWYEEELMPVSNRKMQPRIREL